MNLRFGDFELEESRRELRLKGREIVLQPRVFDLLLFLIKHRDRVVSKDELLDTLWPDVIVADGAVHRAVSLARSALRQGGMADAVRTYSRQGYRFHVEDVNEGPARSACIPASLQRARAAFEAGAWDDACTALSEADGESALEAADLERWAAAAQYTGRMPEAVPPLERAVAAHAGAGDRRGAARVALQLANLELERRNPAVAQGWRKRAASLLAAVEESAEHGYLAWINSRLAIFAGDMEEAMTQADLTLEIARRLEDPELEALALNYQALTFLAVGDMERGVPLLDEAAATVLSGEVGPWVGGMIFCAVIWGCVNRGDWQRANEWTDQFNRWVEQNGVAPFPGLCRLHRAEILTVRGYFAEAERELLAVREILSATAPYAEGDCYRVLGEVRLARGDLDGAESAFCRAYELGWNPQPGYALLQVKQGKAAQALKELERCLKDASWASQQRRGTILAHCVVVAVVAGELERASELLTELEEDTQSWNPPALEAQAVRARAELAFARREHTEAIAGLRRAARIWQEVGSPFNEGSIRIRLAEFLKADGDADTAELELTAAKRVFRGIGLAQGEIALPE
jgi:DNA-binding winged helix-turn-helix (wHTH) protein/ATP/maltotriose-dependent transcriptional regulator MalT